MKLNRTVYQTMSLIGQFGINMLVPIFACSFLGIYIDRWLGTDFVMIILFFVGAVSGGYNIYRMSKKHMKKTDPSSAYLHGASMDSKKKDGEKNDKED